MIGYVSSLICAVVTFGMALLQLSITFGAPFGEYVLGGQNKVLPKKCVSHKSRSQKKHIYSLIL
ncbi:hypothetical protein [Clostridium sp. BL-8]|uniref:hypothetical protein n=1 Tax=Clostridium sp. BL-8 TaxID=349938 RepID=UPI00098CB838|nr:hypothetical protein [Clostridium sp. BL-8]OOM77609.1 hypothetical protein CLOBL_28660 [Clostridium sp. BL-8]